MPDNSSSSEESEDFIFQHFDAETDLRPYLFEPEIEVESDTDDNECDESGSDFDNEHNRLQNSNW